MANIKSQKKRIKTNAKRTERNKAVKSELKTRVKTATIAADEGIRADTTYEGVAKIKPALPGGVVAAGNASQFSDGASVCVVMSDAAAAAKLFPRLEEIAHKVLFGSDWPGPAVPAISRNVAEIEALPLSETAMKKVLRDNALAVYRVA